MLSDDSSSDSETGRFKCRTNQDERKKEDSSKTSARSRHGENNRFRRDIDRRRDDRDRFDKYSRDRDRYRHSRHSPVNRRKYSQERNLNRRSRERSQNRRSHERSQNRRSHERSLNKRSSERNLTRRSQESSLNRRSRERSIKRKPLDTVPNKAQEIDLDKIPLEKSLPKKSHEKSPKRISHERYKDKHNNDSRGGSKLHDYGSNDNSRRSKSRSVRSPEHKKEVKDGFVIKDHVKELSSEKHYRKSIQRGSSSPDYRGKRSEVYIPPQEVSQKRKSDSPIIVEENASDVSEEVKPGSYYNMIPAIIKDKSDDTSDIDSSDDERLRAKLLNLEKELSKTKKKKHKKKHKKSSKSRERGHDTSTSVEVTSTTDIQDEGKADKPDSQVETVPEVTSTQKGVQKESSEEGEISSDDDSQNNIDIDPTDLRHKLRRTAFKNKSQEITDVCGPALPPHLEEKFDKKYTEGPALPPHLQRKSNIGPSIPDDMRKVLAETDCQVMEFEISDEDDGIGPLPVGAEGKWSEAHQRLEERALDMKIKKLDAHGKDHKVKSREQWMLELPEAKAKHLGLEARTFRAKEGPDMSNRSSWTDTPEEKARKAAGIEKEEDVDVVLKHEARIRHIASRDEEQEKAVKKHKKKHKREESLLEIHQKKLKKKKKKEDKDDDKKERRPFSRDVDLQVNRFDDAQKKSIIKKAQDLNTRFSRGEAKFL